MALVAEAFAFSGGTVDETGPYPVVKGVLLCGLTSEHGYDYDPAAWTDAALAQYDGAPSFEGHKAGARLPSEKVGVFRNPRRDEQGRPRADYYLDPDHELTPRVIRAAKYDPAFLALSHRADVRKGTRNGRTVVEAFHRIHSVDLVSRGGTTKGIFESGRHAVATVKLTQVIESWLGRLPADRRRSARKQVVVMEDDAVMAPAMDADVPEPDAAGDPDDALWSGFAAAIQSIADSYKAGEMDAKAAGKKIVAYLKAHAGLTSGKGGDDAGDADDAAPEKPAEEAAPTAAEVFGECVAEAFTPSAAIAGTLSAIRDKAARLTLIREMKGLSARTAPRSTGREGSGKGGTVSESGGDSAPPTGVEEARQAMAAIRDRRRGTAAAK